jgi:hypothetical protein
MNNSIIKITAVFASVLIAHAAPAQEKPIETVNAKPIKIEIADQPALVLGAMRITLSQAIEWAVKQNFDMLSTSYDVAMVDTQYNQFLKKFAPVLSGEVTGGYAKSTPEMKTFQGVETKKLSLAASIYKNFSSGTKLIAGLTHEYNDMVRVGGLSGLLFSGLSGPNMAHKPGVFISIQQELLNNAFGYNDRMVEEIFKNVSKMQKEAIIFQLSIVIVQVIGEYWSTVISKVSLENADLQVRETKKVRDITARNAGYGLADDYTLNYYNSLVAGSEARVVMTRQKYRESLRSFLTIINVNENTDVTATAVFTDRYPAVNIEEALKTAYLKRADYQNALLNYGNANLGAKVAENNTLPSLVLELSGKSKGDHKYFPYSYGEVGSLQYPAIEGKLKISYPIGDNDLYIQERNARFKLKQAKIQLDKYTRTVKDDVMNSTDNIETTFKVYQKAITARRQSELFYQGMLTNLRRGKITSAVAKNGLDALVQSREQELQALVGYNIALLQFDVARNVLFEKYNIDVEKYIPKDTRDTKNNK